MSGHSSIYKNEKKKKIYIIYDILSAAVGLLEGEERFHGTISVTTLEMPFSCLTISFSNTDLAQLKGGIPALERRQHCNSLTFTQNQSGMPLNNSPYYKL